MAQPHTFTGERGDTVINRGERPADAPTVTYHDIYDAVIVGYNRSRGAADGEDPYKDDEAYVQSLDPVSIAQNVCVALEQKEGIYPNVPPVPAEEVDRDEEPSHGYWEAGDY